MCLDSKIRFFFDVNDSMWSWAIRQPTATILHRGPWTLGSKEKRHVLPETLRTEERGPVTDPWEWYLERGAKWKLKGGLFWETAIGVFTPQPFEGAEIFTYIWRGDTDPWRSHPQGKPDRLPSHHELQGWARGELLNFRSVNGELFILQFP